MAIKPDNCGPLSAKERKEISILEEKIDTELRANYKEGWYYCWAANELALVSSKAGAEIIRRYKDVGWIVEVCPGEDFGSSNWYFVDGKQVNSPRSQKLIDWITRTETPSPETDDG